MKSDKFYNTPAWTYFRKYVMLYHAKKSNGEYYVTCATSKRTLLLPHENTICGHYIKVFGASGQTSWATAFDFRNCLPQSKQQNIHMGGNQSEMAESINRIHGSGTTDELYRLSKEYCTMNKADLQEQRDKWKARFKELVKIKGNPWK